MILLNLGKVRAVPDRIPGLNVGATRMRGEWLRGRWGSPEASLRRAICRAARGELPVGLLANYLEEALSHAYGRVVRDSLLGIYRLPTNSDVDAQTGRRSPSPPRAQAVARALVRRCRARMGDQNETRTGDRGEI